MHSLLEHSANTDVLLRRSIAMIIIFSLMGTLASLSGFISSLHSLSGAGQMDATFCLIAPKVYSTAYVFLNSALCEFLNIRSELVKMSDYQDKKVATLRTITKIIARCVPFMSILTLVFWKGEVVIEDGVAYCNDALNWEVSLTIACLTIPSAFLFLLLFVWPLIGHYSQMKQENMEYTSDIEDLFRVIKRNTILSVVAMCSTMIAMTIITYLSRNSADIVYNNVGVAVADLDIAVNLICICLMTDKWMPKKLKEMLPKNPFLMRRKIRAFSDPTTSLQGSDKKISHQSRKIESNTGNIEKSPVVPHISIDSKDPTTIYPSRS